MNKNIGKKFRNLAQRLFSGRLITGVAVLGGVALLVLLGAAGLELARAQNGADAPPVNRGVEVSPEVTPARFDGDVRDLPTLDLSNPDTPPREIPRRVTQSTASPAGEPGLSEPFLDRLLERQANVETRAFVPPEQNFEGIPFANAFPPDTVGDVGLNHYIQMVNDGLGGSAVQIFNKTGGTLAGPFSLQTLWTAGGPCASGLGDPIVLYDGLADRWLLTEFSGVANRLCIYVSQTPDPVAGGWFLYEFATPSFPDYPKYGVWPDAYYAATNEASPAVYAFDRTQMLAGLPATAQRFTAPDLAGFGFQALIPSDVDGATAPPAGSPNYMIRHNDDEAHNPGGANPVQDFLEIFEFHVDFVTPANSMLVGPIQIAVSEFDSHLCGFNQFFRIPQPGTGTILDPVQQTVMWRFQYRNFGTHETLVGNLTVDVDGTDHAGVRWFELRRTGGPWTLFQEGTYAPDANHRWMGSIAMDGDGNIALGYSVSSTTVFPSIRYAGRLASDPLGTLPQGEGTILNGTFSQTATTRWGDYTAMSVDPVNDCTFWHTNEYVQAGGTWRTRIASFTFPGCGGPPNDPPIVNITSPLDGSTHPSGSNILFQGTAMDTEDGDISASLSWNSSIDGVIGAGASFSAVLNDGSHVVTASVVDSGGKPGSDSISIVVGDPPNDPPVVVITSPPNGAGFSSTDIILFEGTATDTADGDISANLQWTSSADGLIGMGASFSSTLSAGGHIVTATVTDSDGNPGSAFVRLSITAGGTNAPVVTIDSPANGAAFDAGVPIQFLGTATDAEDGDITAGLTWTSSIDGIIGTGGRLTAALSAGGHLITAEVTDSDGNSGSATVRLSIN